MSKSKKIIRFLSSLKLAVVIISYICVIIAIGTLVESKYDAQAAKAQVYDSFWMYLGMGALATSLISVMADRWPWKKRHAPFLLAHIGIILIIIGSIVTLRMGIDGSMSVPIGQSSRHVTLPNPQIIIYASFGERLSKMFERPVDFFKLDLKKNPLIFGSGEEVFKFTDFKPYVIPQRVIKPSEDPFLGSAVRFQITNGQFQQVDWLVQRKAGTSALQDLGPLRLRLGGERSPESKNEVILEPTETEDLNYFIYSKDSRTLIRKGKVKEGDDFELGWMGLKLKVLRYHARAHEKWDIQERETPTPLTVSAVQLAYKGEDHWILLNDTLRIFSQTTAYFVSYVHERLDLGFDIHLKEFIKENYQGTQKAMEYKSVVDMPDLGTREITMNEPLEYKGLTFYQASFQEDTFGQPTGSVFSVNYDPGRPWKYGGSIIMTLGIVLLFISRRQKKT